MLYSFRLNTQSVLYSISYVISNPWLLCFFSNMFPFGSKHWNDGKGNVVFSCHFQLHISCTICCNHTRLLPTAPHTPSALERLLPLPNMFFPQSFPFKVSFYFLSELLLVFWTLTQVHFSKERFPQLHQNRSVLSQKYSPTST